jgi:pimeloyl-ACP methyl ester carboxylesterase
MLVVCQFCCSAVSFDMRGYGESTKPKDVKAYRLDKLVEDVKNMIEFLGGLNVFFLLLTSE